MQCSVVLILWLGVELVHGGVTPARMAKALSGKETGLSRGVYCLVGSEWDSSCGFCRCSDEGRAVCQRREGCNATDKELETQCAPDTIWRNDCNTCWCSDQGRAMCTRMGCSYVIQKDKLPEESSPTKAVSEANQPLVRKSRATEEVRKACQPGQEFRMDCNTCLCDDKGKDFSCTRHDCNTPTENTRSKREAPESAAENVTMQCVAGSVFNRDCNVCRCADDGQRALCTHKPCVAPTSPNTSGGTSPDTSAVPESDPNFRCNPGEQLKRGCNDCQCSADGRSVFCTVRFCDQDITPPTPNV